MFLAWLISFVVLAIILVPIICDWCSKDPKSGKKIVLSILLFIVVIAFTIISLFAFNPSTYTGRVKSVTITKLDEVYKSNTSTCYYVSKLTNDSIYEVSVSNVSQGTENFIITREYEKGTISHELVVTNVEKIPLLPLFTK